MFEDEAAYMGAVHRVLKRGDVLRIKGQPPFQSSSYHFFAVLNVDPATEEVLLLVSGTSQVQKRLEARLKISNNDGQYVADTTKVFPESSYTFLSTQTLFDCNEVHSVRLEIIQRKNLLVDNFSLSEEDITDIVHKVGNSKLVEPRIKHQLGL